MEPSPVLIPPPLPPNRLVRIRGWVLVFLGPLLCAGMAFLIYSLTMVINGRHGEMRWNGDARMTAWTFGIFRSIFVFGLAAFGCGVSLLRRARIGWVLGVFFGVSLGAICWYAYQILSNSHPA